MRLQLKICFFDSSAKSMKLSMVCGLLFQSNEQQAAVVFTDESILTDFAIWKCCTTYDNKNIVKAD